MKIKRISITGFGRFTGWEHDFSDGLNVVYGLNESGKTTLHRFILGMLYGFKEPHKSRRGWRDEHGLYEPWSGAPYQGALEFYGEDGRCYRVERQFDKERDIVRVFDALTGEDLSGDYPIDKRRELLFAEAHTGMNELIFISTACIGELPGVTEEKGLHELGARLANLQESGEEVTSLHKAATILEEIRKAQNHRRNKAIAHNEQAQARWLEMCKHRNAARQLEQELSGLQVAANEMQEKRKEALASLLAADIAVLQARLTKASDLANELQQLDQATMLLAKYAQFPVDSRDKVKEILVLLTQDEQVLIEKNQQLATLTQEIQQGQQQLNATPGADTYKNQGDWDTASAQISNGQARWEQLITDLSNAKERWAQAENVAEKANEALTPYAGLAQLPANAPHMLDEMAAINREVGGVARTLNTCNARIYKMQEHIQQYLVAVQNNEAKIANYSHMAALPAQAGELVQEWASEAQALKQAAAGLLETNRSDIEQGEKAQSRLATLEKVKTAGEEQLRVAERLQEQEKAERLRAEAADTQAEAVEPPPTGKLVTGWLLLLAGTISGFMTVFIVEWRSIFGALAALFMLSSVVMLVTWRKVRAARQQEKQRWYNTKGTARATVAKLGADIHNMATAVGQPSIPAWQDAWRTVLACQAEVERAQAAKASVQNLLYKRQQYTEKVLALLAQAGIANSIEWNPGTWELPWTATDLQRFYSEQVIWRDLQQERLDLPQRVEGVPHEAVQIAREVENLYDNCQQLQTRLVESMPKSQMEQESIALTQMASTQLVVENDNELLEQWNTIPADMRNATVTDAVSQLPAMARLTVLVDVLTAIEQITDSVANNLISLSGADDATGFAQRWQQWLQAKQEVQQAKEKAKIMAEAYIANLEQCQQFLGSVIHPLINAVEIPLPSLPEKTTAEQIPVWVNAICQTVERIDAGRKLCASIAELHTTHHSILASIELKMQEQQSHQINLKQLFIAVAVTNVNEYENAWMQKQQYDATLTQVEATRRELEGVLGGNTIEELATQMQTLHSQQANLPAAKPPQERSVMQEVLKSLDNDLAAIKQQMIVAENEIKNHLLACAGEEELTAELENIGTEQAAATLASAAVQLAKEQLGLAADEVHRQLAPALNARASAIMSKLTRGRYSQLVVDRHIAIQVLDQHFARQVAVGAVSRGTADQLYLAFRLAAVDVITQGRFRPPLLVDDAFAYYDDDRAQEGLRTMLKLAQLTQVILFTCRQRDVGFIQGLSQQNQAPIQIINLPAPA